METGIYESISSQEYHSDVAINSTSLKTLLEATPAHFKHKRDNPTVMEGDSLLAGTVLHAMLLEPNKYQDYFVIEHIDLVDKNKLEKNGGSKGQWDALKKDAEARGLPLVPYEMFRDCKGMRNSVLNNPFWRQFWPEMRCELSLFNEIDNVPVRARFDAIIGSSVILDIKTTKGRLSDKEIESCIEKYRYDFSAAMYIEVARSFDLPIESFVWVFVEKEAPFSCRVVQCNQETLDYARQDFYKALSLYKSCLQDDYWPSYDDYELPSLGLPQWYIKKNK